MLVVATRKGFYGLKRHYPADSEHPLAGRPFKLKSKEEFSPRWMEEYKKKGPGRPPEKDPEQEAPPEEVI